MSVAHTLVILKTPHPVITMFKQCALSLRLNRVIAAISNHRNVSYL